MTFESEGLLIVAIYTWLPPASYVVFSDNSGCIPSSVWCIVVWSVAFVCQFVYWSLQFNELVYILQIKTLDRDDQHCYNNLLYREDDIYCFLGSGIRGQGHT